MNWYIVLLHFIGWMLPWTGILIINIQTPIADVVVAAVCAICGVITALCLLYEFPRLSKKRLALIPVLLFVLILPSLNHTDIVALLPVYIAISFVFPLRLSWQRSIITAVLILILFSVVYGIVWAFGALVYSEFFPVETDGAFSNDASSAGGVLALATSGTLMLYLLVYQLRHS